MRQSSGAMHRRLHTAAFVMPLMLASGACVVHRLPAPDASASLRVRVTLEENVGVNLRTFVARHVRIMPVPTLPSMWMPLVSPGAGMFAVATGRPRESWMFVVDVSSASPPSVTVFPVTYRQEGEDGTTLPDLKPQAAPTPPCELSSGFFVKGVGDLPGAPVVLHRWAQDSGPYRAILVDPARHTLVLHPVLRFSTRDIKGLRNRKATFLLGIKADPGTKPFLLLGLMRKPDGSYTEAVFRPDGQEKGWSAFIHTPGETTEISFYALDDSPALDSVCREQTSKPSTARSDPGCFRSLEEFCATDKCRTYEAQLDTMRANGNCYGTVGRCGAFRITHRGDGFVSETRYFDKAGRLIAVRTASDFNTGHPTCPDWKHYGVVPKCQVTNVTQLCKP